MPALFAGSPFDRRFYYLDYRLPKNLQFPFCRLYPVLHAGIQLVAGASFSVIFFNRPGSSILLDQPCRDSTNGQAVLIKNKK
jgi:hypothetical protein